MDRSDPPHLTPLQERAMWAMARLSKVTYATRLEDGTDPPWVVMSTVRALHRKGLVDLDVRERMVVTTSSSDDQAPVVEWRSPIVWDACLTRAGQEWVAVRMVEIEGLAPPPPLATV